MALACRHLLHGQLDGLRMRVPHIGHRLDDRVCTARGGTRGLPCREAEFRPLCLVYSQRHTAATFAAATITTIHRRCLPIYHSLAIRGGAAAGAAGDYHGGRVLSAGYPPAAYRVARTPDPQFTNRWDHCGCCRVGRTINSSAVAATGQTISMARMGVGLKMGSSKGRGGSVQTARGIAPTLSHNNAQLSKELTVTFG